MALFFGCLNMKRLLFIGQLFFIFLFLPVLAETEEASFHICYFSLNNEKEFKEMDKFIRKLNEHSSHPITITEYMTRNKNPEESFIKMVESGEKCDGLVISGHHTGSFGGERSHGSLGINFLEKLSCDERYANWFNSIKALWLQGCRTLGTGEIVPNEEEGSADYHTTRVGALLEVDHLEQSFEDLNIEFSATLDQDNPLSSRYLRIFPAANVFGWTETAPGKLAGSQYSLPFHIAHLAKRLNEEDRFPSEGPLDRIWTEESAIKYRESLSLILSGGEQCGVEAVEAWKSHGKARDQSTEYGFLNPDLQAYPALMLTEDEILMQARLYNCILRHSIGEKLLDVLDAILKDFVFIRYTYNSLLERLQSFRGREEDVYTFVLRPEEEEINEDMYSQVIEKLKTSPELNAFLSGKLNSRSLGILRKIDYYAFYEEIYGRQERVRTIILNKSKEVFQNISSNSFNEVDYKRTLLRSLSRHGYLQNEQGMDLLKQVMGDPSRRLRRSAVMLVSVGEGRFYEGEVLSFAQEAIEDSNSYLRASAVMLAGYRVRFRSSDFISIAKKIIERGLKDVLEVRISLAEMAGDIAGVIEDRDLFSLSKEIVAVTGRNREVRKFLVDAFVDAMKKVEIRWKYKFLSLLEELAGDSDEGVQLILVDRFGDIVSIVWEDALPIFEKLMEFNSTEDVLSELVYELEDIIWIINIEESLPIFEKLLASSEYIRESTLDIIADNDDPVFIPLLRKTLGNPDLGEYERTYILKLIEGLGR